MQLQDAPGLSARLAHVLDGITDGLLGFRESPHHALNFTESHPCIHETGFMPGGFGDL
jgi:hypothetical protein